MENNNPIENAGVQKGFFSNPIYYVLIVLIIIMAGVVIFYLGMLNKNSESIVEQQINSTSADSKEKEYINTTGGHHLSFVNPEGFKVDVIDKNYILNDIQLYVSPINEPAGTDNCYPDIGPLIRLTTFGENHASYATSSETYIAEQPNYLGEKTFGNNVYLTFEGHGQEYVMVGKNTVLKITYNPEICTWKNNDYDSKFEKMLTSLNFIEASPRQDNLNENQIKSMNFRKDIVKAYENGELKSVRDCPVFSRKYEPNDQFTVNHECEGFDKLIK